MNFKTFIAVMLIFVNFVAFGQLDIKLNTSSLIDKKVEISTELGGEKFGLDFNFAYSIKKWGDFTNLDGQSLGVPRKAFTAGVKYNFYFRPKTSMDGFYAAPYLNYQHHRLTFAEPTKHNRLAAGLIFGRKGFFNEHFGYLIEMGGGYNFIYKYNNVATGQKVDVEESIPILGDIIKIALPFRASIVYRIGEYD